MTEISHQGDGSSRPPIILIGQAPSRTGDPTYPLTGRFGRRIQELAGVNQWAYLRRTVRINVLPVYPGPKGKGDDFPLDGARKGARTIAGLGAFSIGRDVVLFGWNVARVFGLDRSGWLTWCVPDEVLGMPCNCRVAISPHPSGVSTWWCDPRNVDRAKAFWQELLR